MRITACAAAVVAMGIATGQAGAADTGSSPGPYYSAPVYAPTSVRSYSWMGPYLGANVGYQWGSATNSPTNPNGFAGGIQGGYNFQSGQFVFGGETDLQLSAADDTFAPWKFANPWFGTLRGRAGVALNNILLYGTGGMAYGGGRAHVAGISESRTQLGWAAGLGVEVGFTPNWSAKAEYLYVDLSERGYTVVGTQNGFESNLLRFGVNYRF
ncbi:MAG: outer membrane beta-barrel protein [Rhizobiales bacterium]|nr:outer membrane beta-barrel protein [Hyphomicrobiales bacterium]